MKVTIRKVTTTYVCCAQRDGARVWRFESQAHDDNPPYVVPGPQLRGGSRSLEGQLDAEDYEPGFRVSVETVTKITEEVPPRGES